jgi:hypothetical protein
MFRSEIPSDAEKPRRFRKRFPFLLPTGVFQSVVAFLLLGQPEVQIVESKVLEVVGHGSPG